MAFKNEMPMFVEEYEEDDGFVFTEEETEIDPKDMPPEEEIEYDSKYCDDLEAGAKFEEELEQGVSEQGFEADLVAQIKFEEKQEAMEAEYSNDFSGIYPQKEKKSPQLVATENHATNNILKNIGEVNGKINKILEYAKCGWYVFPLLPNTKIPLRGFKWREKSTVDSEEIKKYWTENPDYNVGLDCGKSGLVVVDIDCKNNIDGWANWEKLNIETNALRQSTPSGGLHLFFKCEPPLPKKELVRIATSAEKYEPSKRKLNKRKESKKAKSPYFEESRFIPKRLADTITTRTHFKTINGIFYIYENGVYRLGGENVLAFKAQTLLEEYSSNSRIREVVEHIRREVHTNPPEISRTHINVKNGRLNWKTGELEPHTPEIFELVQLPIIYDPEKKCPELDKFFLTTLGTDLVPLAQEIFAFCLVPNNKFEKAILFVGEGENGKSVFIDTLSAFLGQENVSSISLQNLEDDKFTAAQLHGKLANLFADLDRKAMTSSKSFKILISGDLLSAEFKFKQKFNFRNYAKLIFSANEIPRSTDVTYAFYRRWLIVPFDNQFKKGKNAITNLREILSQPDELSGMLNVAVSKLRWLHDHSYNFSETEQTKKKLDEYKRMNNSVLAFCQDNVEIREDAEISKSALYEYYRTWALEEGLKPVAQNRIKHTLKVFAPDVVEYQKRIGTGTKRERYWSGIKLSSVENEVVLPSPNKIEKKLERIEISYKSG